MNRLIKTTLIALAIAGSSMGSLSASAFWGPFDSWGPWGGGPWSGPYYGAPYYGYGYPYASPYYGNPYPTPWYGGYPYPYAYPQAAPAKPAEKKKDKK